MGDPIRLTVIMGGGEVFLDEICSSRYYLSSLCWCNFIIFPYMNKVVPFLLKKKKRIGGGEVKWNFDLLKNILRVPLKKL